jgi:hypothetical protein
MLEYSKQERWQKYQMRFAITILAVLLFVAQLGFGQLGRPNVIGDERIIDFLNTVNRLNPTQVETFFSNGSKINKGNLGFGWKVSFLSLSGDQMGLSIRIYYYRDSIVTYVIYPRTSVDTFFINHYLNLLKTIDIKIEKIRYSESSNEISKVVFTPITYNENGILKPLIELEDYKGGMQLSDDLLRYMSPESGLSYGWMGGNPGTILENRKAFNSIKSRLTKDSVIALLYSMNPVSRLTTIEFCIKMKYRILKKPDIANWIERIYNEVKEVSTFNGCIGGPRDSRELVRKYSTLKTE